MTSEMIDENNLVKALDMGISFSSEPNNTKAVPDAAEPIEVSKPTGKVDEIKDQSSKKGKWTNLVTVFVIQWPSDFRQQLLTEERERNPKKYHETVALTEDEKETAIIMETDPNSDNRELWYKRATRMRTLFQVGALHFVTCATWKPDAISQGQVRVLNRGQVPVHFMNWGKCVEGELTWDETLFSDLPIRITQHEQVQDLDLIHEFALVGDEPHQNFPRTYYDRLPSTVTALFLSLEKLFEPYRVLKFTPVRWVEQKSIFSKFIGWYDDFQVPTFKQYDRFMTPAVRAQMDQVFILDTNWKKTHLFSDPWKYMLLYVYQLNLYRGDCFAS